MLRTVVKINKPARECSMGRETITESAEERGGGEMAECPSEVGNNNLAVMLPLSLVGRCVTKGETLIRL